MTDQEREWAAPSAEATEAQPAAAATEAQPAALFPEEERVEFRSRWDVIQTKFVDEPRASVEEANKLVEDTVKRLDAIFTDQRAQLEQEWAKGSDVSTEDLRLALRRYRSFFDRLLSV